LLPHLYCKKPREQEGYDSVIVVDNIPVVGADRIKKLKTVLTKIFSEYGKFVGEPFYPVDENGSTKG
jgi:translation initiation factor 3 subunit B